MAISFKHKNDLTIELFEDSAFNPGPDSTTSYDRVIQAMEDNSFSPTSKHAIKVFKDSNLVASAILLGSGAGTSVYKDTAMIDGDNLVILSSNKVFSLTLPNLETNWVTESDWVACFSIHRYQNTYIVYGETSITRIDKAGRTLWSFSGKDIFVCANGSNPFEMHDTFIALTDFVGSTYQIDYDGNAIDFKEPSDHFTYNQPPNTIQQRQKRWWKFW